MKYWHLLKSKGNQLISSMMKKVKVMMIIDINGEYSKLITTQMVSDQNNEASTKMVATKLTV